MVLAVFLKFSGKKTTLETSNIQSQPNSGDDFKACLSHHFSVMYCCIFLARLTYFHEQAAHTDNSFPLENISFITTL